LIGPRLVAGADKYLKMTNRYLIPKNRVRRRETLMKSLKPVGRNMGNGRPMALSNG
jgi:hypothetical protein